MAPSNTATAVSIGEQKHVLKIVVGFQAFSGSVAKRAVGVGSSDRKIFDEPCRARGDKTLEGFEGSGDRLAPIDGQAHVMSKGRGQQLFVAGPLVKNPLKHLKSMFEGVALRVPRSILSHRFEHRHNGHQAIEAVADD